MIEHNEYKWNTHIFSNPPIDEALIGDIYAMQNRETGDIEGRYLKVDRTKRNWQDLESNGYVSLCDIKSMHLPHCKMVYYASACKS